MNQDDLKKAVALEALKFVKSGMVLGLGTGSTAKFFVEGLAAALKRGDLQNIVGVATSEATAKLASSLGVRVDPLSAHEVIDLAVDGADEVDPNFDLIKGHGKAFLREKAVEKRAKRFVVIVDESKMVERLGVSYLPIEFQQEYQAEVFAAVAHLGCQVELWVENEQPVVSDSGNHLAKCWFERGIADARALAASLEKIPGLLDHGLFLGMATEVVVGGESGVRVVGRNY